MLFRTAIIKVESLLQAGHVDAAKTALDEAWALAKAKGEERAAHAMGNKVQAAIFESYLNQR